MPATNGRTYKCLNPVGTNEPSEQFPLAARLDALDGKTVHLSICGEADIWVPLEKRFKTDFPEINWTMRKTYTPTPNRLTEEEMKTTDAVILGVCW
jgi:hypothetical protein